MIKKKNNWVNNGNIMCNEWKTDSEENSNTWPKKKTKHRMLTVTMEISAYSSR
jgi:hypothetical protein